MPTKPTAVLETAIDPAAIKAANDNNSKTATLFFFHKDEADKLLKDYIAATGSAPKRPKGTTAIIPDNEKTIIVGAINSGLTGDNATVNLTVFGNIINKALAKNDIDLKNPAKVTAIALQLAKEGVISYVPSNGKLHPAKISLATLAEK